ncbi:MAG: pilus assembly protein TadG-related protein [Steroidobacteraceae bacterium]
MRRPHSGQALVVMLALLAGMLGAFALVLNAGVLVNDKMRLTNAADAAAYSAAQWQARSLNYQAYLNRAMVANEVAIAQLVSLRSWSRYIETTTGNASRVAQFIPPLAAPMRALAVGWNRIDTVIGNTIPPLESGLSRWNGAVLATSQAVAHVQAPLAAADLVTQVARLNEPRAQVSAATRLLQARNGEAWLNRFTTRYQRGSGDLRRFSTLLMNSRDGFSRSRRSDLPVQLGLVSLPRRGGTDLLGEYSWRALDTLSLHVDLLLGEVETPIGWGAAENRRQVVSQSGDHGGSRRRNPRASRLALRLLRPATGYTGVPEIRDVVNPAARDTRSLTYSVALDLPRDAIQSVDRLLMPLGIAVVDGPPEPVNPDLAGDALHAIGSAEVYFQRPEARADGREEYPSLFSPYWQARLAPTPAVTRQAIATYRGLGLDPFAVLP